MIKTNADMIKTDINRSVSANQYIGLSLQEPRRNSISFDFNELHCELLHEYLQSSTLLKENMKDFSGFSI